MANQVFFSVVVPTYNRAQMISATIESILAQSYQYFELIIVDDGSKDNTEEVLSKYLSEKVKYYKKSNEERAAARNYGTRQAKGDYVNWFDSDDIMLPDHLKTAAESIMRLKRPEIIAQGFVYQDTNGKILQLFRYPPNISEQMYKGNLIANSPVIVRRDIAMANPFNEDRSLSGSEDYELWLRIAAKYEIRSSPHTTVALIYHPDRSTIIMSDPDQLVQRYTKFIKYTTTNDDVLRLLGHHRDFFIMKNYLMLAVDLLINNHVNLSRAYLSKGFNNSFRIIFEKGFYAYIKHFLILNTFTKKSIPDVKN